GGDLCMNARLLILLALLGCTGLPDSPARADDSTFVQKVAPVLRQRCGQCHGPKKTKGGLDVSTRDLLLEGGDHGLAIVPGEAAKSLLLKLVSGPEPKMPKQGQRLTAGQVADLRRWIDAGAPWPKTLNLGAEGPGARPGDWWSLRPLVRPALPAVKDAARVRTPIDAFILAAL